VSFLSTLVAERTPSRSELAADVIPNPLRMGTPAAVVRA
jgi:hypothetical protein